MNFGLGLGIPLAQLKPKLIQSPNKAPNPIEKEMVRESRGSGVGNEGGAEEALLAPAMVAKMLYR